MVFSSGVVFSLGVGVSPPVLVFSSCDGVVGWLATIISSPSMMPSDFR